MAVLRTLFSALAVLLSALLYYRSNIIYTFYANRPNSLEYINTLRGLEIHFDDYLRNCEDAYLNEEDGWALLSCDPGRDKWNTVMGTFVDSSASPQTGLYLYTYSAGLDSRPEKLDLGLSEEEQRDFHPLGVEYHPQSKTIFVANHAFSHCKLELYKLDLASRSAAQIDSLYGRQFAAPNSIAAISDKEFFFTNDHHFLARHNPILAKVETYGGIPGGSVNHVKLLEGDGVQVKVLARVPFANGVVLLNSSTLAVSSTTGASILLYSISRNASEPGAAPELTLASTISVPFLPDNLSVDSQGTLLIAGHPHAPSLEKIAKTNQYCQSSINATSEQCQHARLSWIAEWSEKRGLRRLYTGDDYGTVTTALRDVSRGFGFATGLYERGVLTWKL